MKPKVHQDTYLKVSFGSFSWKLPIRAQVISSEKDTAQEPDVDDSDWLEYILDDDEVKLVINSDEDSIGQEGRFKKERKIYDPSELL